MIKNQSKLISIIMPNFDGEKFLDDAIGSVINQSYTNWELIIIDDASNDSSLEIINRYTLRDSRIKLNKNDHNMGGPAAPRNLGIKSCTGDYIAFIDSDDIWTKDKLLIQMNLIENSKYAFVSSKKYNFRFNKNKIIKTNKNDIQFKTIDYQKLIHKNFIYTSSVLISKNLIKSYSFNLDKKYIAVEDYDLWLKILKNECINVAIIKQKLILYRKNNQQSISRQKIKMAKKISNIQKQHSKNIAEALYYFCNYFVKSIANMITN